MKSILYFLFLALPFQLAAQLKISATIVDDQGKPVDGATVSLLQNGKLLSTRMADKGSLSFTELTATTYDITISLVGYKTVQRSFLMPKDSLLIMMVTDYATMQQVGVTYRKATVTRQIDKLVFNVDNSVLASGGNAWDALGKAPGVQMGNGGQIRANNKSVAVYLDGKPVRVSGDDLASYLQSIPSDNIAKIEVMTNPSSKYEAQGGAVINIITKKSKADGFNTSLSAGYTRGELNRFNGNGVFNFRKNKLNIFGNYGYSDRDTRRYYEQYTNYNDPADYAYWDMHRNTRVESKGSNYTAGLDYNLTANQVLGLLFNGNNTNTDSYGNGDTYVFNRNRTNFDSVLHTMSGSSNKINQYSFNINYKIRLDSNGRSLNVDVDYSPYTKSNIQKLLNQTYSFNKIPVSDEYRITSPSQQTINIWSGKVDYNYQLHKSVVMESGFKYTSIISNSKFDFYNMAGGSSTIDPARSDRFEYIENTSAVYTTATYNNPKWSLKGGLRAEYTTTGGTSASLDSVNRNQYLRLFPTAVINYMAAANHVIGFSYSKRIERPDYRQLNPARSYSTPYNYWSGNPFLKPMIINDARISYTMFKDYTISVVYTQIDDMSSNVIIQDNTSKTGYDTQQNLGTIIDKGVEFASVHHPASWWEINNLAQGYFRSQRSDHPGNSYNFSQFYYYLRADHTFTLHQNSGVRAELSAWYGSPQQQGSWLIKETYDLSFGFSKPLFRKQGTIRLSVADALNGNPFHIVISNAPKDNGMYQQNDTRTVTLSFSYKLGKSIAAARRRATASEEERKRVN